MLSSLSQALSAPPPATPATQPPGPSTAPEAYHAPARTTAIPAAERQAICPLQTLIECVPTSNTIEIAAKTAKSSTVSAPAREKRQHRQENRQHRQQFRQCLRQQRQGRDGGRDGVSVSSACIDWHHPRLILVPVGGPCGGTQRSLQARFQPPAPAHQSVSMWHRSCSIDRTWPHRPVKVKSDALHILNPCSLPGIFCAPGWSSCPDGICPDGIR